MIQHFDFELVGLREISLSKDEEDEAPLLRAKKRKTNYNAMWKSQMVWVAKLPWANAFNGVLYMVKCNTCFIYNKKSCICMPKWDTLKKYKGYRTTNIDIPTYDVKKAQSYIAKNCRHKKNMQLHMSKSITSVLQQHINLLLDYNPCICS